MIYILILGVIPYCYASFRITYALMHRQITKSRKHLLCAMLNSFWGFLSFICGAHIVVIGVVIGGLVSYDLYQWWKSKDDDDKKKFKKKAKSLIPKPNLTSPALRPAYVAR